MKYNAPLRPVLELPVGSSWIAQERSMVRREEGREWERGRGMMWGLSDPIPMGLK